MLILTGAFAVVFALINIFISRLSFLDSVPRSRWLSFAGGVAVAYVFLHIMPELSEHQETFAEALKVSKRAAEALLDLVALFGLILFYGLERSVKVFRKASATNSTGAKLLWFHIFSFSIYNMLIGYLLLHREENGVTQLFFYTLAMSLHFVANDYGLRQDQKDQYDAKGRWILAGAVLLGWLIGIFVSFPQIVIDFLFSFLAGGVILNVLKEELPEERKSHFWSFALGGCIFAILLIFV